MPEGVTHQFVLFSDAFSEPPLQIFRLSLSSSFIVHHMQNVLLRADQGAMLRPIYGLL